MTEKLQKHWHVTNELWQLVLKIFDKMWKTVENFCKLHMISTEQENHFQSDKREQKKLQRVNPIKQI